MFSEGCVCRRNTPDPEYTLTTVCVHMQAEYMAKFEQYRKARAEAKPVSACSTSQQSSRLTMGAGAARVKAAVKQSAVSLKPERTPLRTSCLQR